MPGGSVLTMDIFVPLKTLLHINCYSMTKTPKPTTPSPAASAAGKIKATHKVRSGLLFLTCATYKRIPLFRYRKPCRILLESLVFYREKYDSKIYGYVLMPNHFHLLL